MKLKAKYQIDNDTWKKLKETYNLLLGSPFVAIVFAFITWPIINNFSWTLVPIVPWALFYLIILSMRIQFFKQSKYTVFLMFLSLSLFTYFFGVIASACVFRLFGTIGLFIQSAFLMLTGIFLCNRYFKYYDIVWESHKYHNENVILDQENGRYDFLNNFNMDEGKVKSQKGKYYSNAALISLIYLISPAGVGIGLIFSKNGNYLIPIIICWILSVPTTLGFIKPVMAGFYIYRKLSYFEKKLGKPIINGLLE